MAERVLRLVLVDDHPVVRRGLRALFTDPAAVADLPELDRVEVVAEAADGQEAVRLLERLRATGQAVDVVLMDLQLPVLDGVGATARITAAPEHPAVLVLTTFDSDADILAALDAGAVGYLLKDAPVGDILRAASLAARGERALDPQVERRLARRTETPQTAPTAREVEILGLIAEGATNREVARRLYLSEATVKTHLVHLFDKLGVENRTAAVRVAREHRILR